MIFSFGYRMTFRYYLGVEQNEKNTISTPEVPLLPSKEQKSNIFSSKRKDVPRLNDWMRNRDGTISGTIFGSDKAPDGSVISTSPIDGGFLSGSVVQTKSGSR